MKHNFRELTVWRKSMNLVFETYKMTRELPSIEKFGLISQVNRCAVSISSNIAEGTSRTTDKEITRFMNIAMGSAYELETQLMPITRLYSNLEPQTITLIDNLNEIQKNDWRI
ncbi:MAG: four helix bundle protein [Bacteroidetes bacterium HGW-Bacteroidetes-12]|nr:MAG: four helix bundle protein [Bacteroidetes bacterium HGW-Bacteroidetes-12]